MRRLEFMKPKSFSYERPEFHCFRLPPVDDKPTFVKEKMELISRSKSADRDAISTETICNIKHRNNDRKPQGYSMT